MMVVGDVGAGDGEHQTSVRAWWLRVVRWGVNATPMLLSESKVVGDLKK
jgi:hypothetical protein